MTQSIQSHEVVFSGIYRRDVWGGSGTGSKEASTRPYRVLLQEMLHTGRFARVVDVGCGDWEFSRLMNWSAVDYLGIDVIRPLIWRNRRLYASKHVRFRCADVFQGDLPEADLYLVKDVLQHWTGGEIRQFLSRMAGRRLLITNTTSAGRYQELECAGGYRPIDLRRAPFRIRAKELLRYHAGPYDPKLVLFVDSKPCGALGVNQAGS